MIIFTSSNCQQGKVYGYYLNVRCKATFIPNICGILTILLLDYALHTKAIF
jgi:hypothetical protein